MTYNNINFEEIDIEYFYGLGVCNKSASLSPDGNVHMPPCSDGEGYESGIFNGDEIDIVYQEIINGDYD